MSSFIPLTRFYQFGYVTRDLDAAMDRLASRYGVARFRRKQTSEWMESAHAWAGDTMLEILALGEGAPALYTDYLPAVGDAARLHHLGYRVELDEWPAVEQAIADAGMATSMAGTVMDGHLRFAYADTRQDLGIYTEFVCLTGPATEIYNDVPRN
jgi:hypothetical protein